MKHLPKSTSTLAATGPQRYNSGGQAIPMRTHTPCSRAIRIAVKATFR